MQKVRCVSTRESAPSQISIGSIYYLDEDTIYKDSDGDEYAKIYTDELKSQLVGHMLTCHFVSDVPDKTQDNDGMNNIYYVKYKLDTGYEFLQDEAIVVAKTEELAVDSLKKSVSKLGPDYWVECIFSIEEFTGVVFTKQYGSNSRFID